MPDDDITAAAPGTTDRPPTERPGVGRPAPDVSAADATRVPRYFFPGAASPEQAEQYREAIVRFARDNGFPATPRRIFRLRHQTDDTERIDEVGQIESQDRREVVVAILQAGKLYLVVTASRGFMRGTPIPYHVDEVREAVDFST
jgi:hypothetical protein